MIILSSTSDDGESPDHRPTTRMTRQRVAILGVLAELDTFQSAQQIHSLVKASGETLGLATVYRYLALMVQAVDLDTLNREDGEAVYLPCSRKHHHHLVCRDCGRAIEINGPDVEEWASQVSALHGFTATTHTLEVFGLCPACSAASKA